MSTADADAQLPLKKRARRRLVGAIALAVLAAVVLPMVMDQAPQAPVADVKITIPGQDQVPAFNPKAKQAEQSAETVKPAEAAKPAPAVVVLPKPEVAVIPPVAAAKPAEPVAARPAEKPAAKPAEKAPDKPQEKPADKPVAKPVDDDSRRAASILSGKAVDSAPAANNAANGGQFVILIGAFANPANVKQLQTKLGEVGVKTYTEMLDSPQGKKTRVRAGPFPNREAAEKGLEKMKRIGVNGIVAARQ